MAWTPPLKHLRKKELMDNERFYRLLSQRSNYMAPESVVAVYLALTMVIVDELRAHKYIRLPILGEFATVRQKSRPAWLGRAHCIIDGLEVLKFYPRQDFRQFIRNGQKAKALSSMPPPPINSN